MRKGIKMNRQQRRKLDRDFRKKVLIHSRKNWKVDGWDTIKFVEKKFRQETNEYTDIWESSLYTAVVRESSDGMTWISFSNKEKTTDIPWSHKQQIKNDICGPNRAGVEIFPKMKDLVDTANQYHLWVFPEDYDIAFGLK